MRWGDAGLNISLSRWCAHGLACAWRMPGPCSWWPRTRRSNAGCTMQKRPCGSRYRLRPMGLRILFRPETHCVLVTLPNHLFCNASLLQAVSRTLPRTHPVGSVVLRTFNSHPHYLLERTQNMLERWDGTSDTEVSSSGRRGEHEHRS